LQPATGESAFATASWFMGSILGRLILFGFTWALFTHLLGGVRHMIQDSGRCMEHPGREYMAYMMAYGGIGLAILAWIIAYAIR
jgi:succinate dehydrogenase / fumarate reductase, cytochrome b subunit